MASILSRPQCVKTVTYYHLIGYMLLVKLWYISRCVGHILPFMWSHVTGQAVTYYQLRCHMLHVNSLALGRSECDSKNWIFHLVLLIAIFRSHDNTLRWMPQDLTDDVSILVQVMAWCHQATSHYLSQCWLSLLSPYDVARPQWIKGSHVSSHLVTCTSYAVACKWLNGHLMPVKWSLIWWHILSVKLSHFTS